MNTRELTRVACFVLSCFYSCAQAETLTGWVSNIVDGDTIAVQDYSNQQHEVRLLGIDAPEKTQVFGGRAQQTLGALLNGRDVEVVWTKRDGEGRIAGKVMMAPDDSPCRNRRECPKTLDAGLAQINAGQAWWDRRNAREQTPQDRASYSKAEFEAKIHRNGLWSGTNPVPPWEFRR